VRWGLWCLLAATLARGQDGPCERGRDLLASKSYPEAQEALWKCVLAGAPGREPAHLLTQTYRELRNYEDGVQRITAVLSGRSASVDLLYLAAFLQFRLRHHQASIELLSRALPLDNYDWRVHHLFALNYIVLHKAEALKEMQRAIELNPSNPEMHYQLARLHYTESRFQESIAASHQALALFPEYPEVYNNLALCYQALSENTKAVENFERAIVLTRKIQRRDEWPFLNYAAFLMKDGEYEKTLPLLREAVALTPESAKTYYYLGRALRNVDQIAEAQAALEKSIELDPQDPASHYELATLLSRRGEKARAKVMFERFEGLRKRSAKELDIQPLAR
jgi:tetratricopeptide (TPR) repeat protein